MELEQKVAIVTGGASGLGEATVRKFIESGAKVGIFDLNEKRGTEISSELGEDAIFCKADITDESSVAHALEKVMASFGAPHLVVNCAGIANPGKIIGRDGLIPLSSFTQVLAVNLIGTFNIIRSAVGQMIHNSPNEDGERGVIINTASVAAFDGQIGQAAYSASKAGIVGMTLPLARELAQYGIRIVTIAPGLFYTPLLEGLPEKAKEALGKMAPFPQRLGKPEEFAELARHIVLNPMLNGETIRLDGALRMAPK